MAANPAPMVDWLQNGEQITPGERYVVESDGLLIVKASEADDGIYTCRAIVVETGELSERNIRVEVSVTLKAFLVLSFTAIHTSVTYYLKIRWAAGVACHLFRNEYCFS